MSEDFPITLPNGNYRYSSVLRDGIREGTAHANCSHPTTRNFREGPYDTAEELVRAAMEIEWHWKWCNDSKIFTNVGLYKPKVFTAIIDDGIDDEGSPNFYYFVVIAADQVKAMDVLKAFGNEIHYEDDWQNDDNPWTVEMFGECLPLYRSGGWNHLLSDDNGDYIMVKDKAEYPHATEYFNVPAIEC